jgi:hypothetical protein
MSEPTTPNIGLIVPNTGDLPGAWGTSAVNPNMSAIDGLFGGTVTLTLSGATTVTLTSSTAVLTPAGGPFQQNNACIFITGSQSANAVIKFSQPGRYIVNNQIFNAPPSDLYVHLSPATGTGRSIGAPAGQKITVFFDGAHMDYVDSFPIGGLLPVFTGNPSEEPPWWAACSTSPFLFCNGSVYNVVDYPALGAMLGSAYGGNGVTTFAVPTANSTFITHAAQGLDSFIYIKT